MLQKHQTKDRADIGKNVCLLFFSHPLYTIPYIQPLLHFQSRFPFFSQGGLSSTAAKVLEMSCYIAYVQAGWRWPVESSCSLHFCLLVLHAWLLCILPRDSYMIEWYEDDH